ncbi:MAG: TrkH family potassium uptake protein, partial [Deltaproteobacteria bacterium]|nr:TrkH family potassium uptake protein [Deltaproteobacteria bacterium]
MDLRAIVFVLGNLLMLLGVALLAPFGVALVADSHSPEVHALAFTAAGAVVVGMAARTLWRKHAAHIRVREGFAVVVLAWLMACVVGMIPYLAAGAITSVTDAFFETMSGFTTTGASVLSRVEVLPPGLLFWRSMTQWLGGGGIVVLSVAIMPMLGAAGYHVLKAETTGGVVFERERPRIAETAKELWLIYLGMSALLIVLLRLCGMSTYDAFCHAFATVATGGFSPHTESIAFFPSPLLQWIVIAFMFMGATNFVLYSQLFRGRISAVFKNPELRLYVAVLLACVATGMWVAPVDGFEPRLRAVAFSVASVSTTTGFTTHDFDQWPHIMRALLL